MKKVFSQGAFKIEYELSRKRVKNLNLRIHTDGSVHVSAPYFTPQRVIDRFIAAHAERIAAAAQKRLLNARAVRTDADSLILAGRRLPVETMRGTKNSALLTGDRVLLSLKDPSDPELRRKALDKLCREKAIEAVEDSVRRIYPIFAAMGLAEAELKFRRMKSRWGSCRYDNASLSFNTALCHVPAPCVDYVVMHEYCHFIHPNHSPAFHGLMTKLMPDWKERKKVLEKYASLL